MFTDSPPSNLTPEILRLREKKYQEKKKLYNELLWWRNYDPLNKHAHITRNSSYGEHLV
jgi:hypothetical protein